MSSKHISIKQQLDPDFSLSKFNRFNPKIDRSEKVKRTIEDYRIAIETFLCDNRYAKERSTISRELLLQEDQVLACKVSKAMNMVDDVRGDVPIDLLRAARQICKENQTITAGDLEIVSPKGEQA